MLLTMTYPIQNSPCKQCQQPTGKNQWSATQMPTCINCREKGRAARRRVVNGLCAWCNIPMQAAGQAALANFRNSGRMYCCKEHISAWKAQASSVAMAKTNRRDASARMIKNNPMQNPETRATVSASLRRIGHRPPVASKGGNGTGLTVPQTLLASRLGWPTEVSIKTGMKRGLGYPNCYKVDIGNPELKIAIEVDGGSHGTIINRARDVKRDALLNGLGWTVLRFKNRVVMESIEDVLSTILKLSERTPTA